MYTNAQYTNPENTSIKVDINGVTSFVPVAPGNSDYTRIQELVASGELTIASYEPPAPLLITEITMRQCRLELYRRNLLTQVQQSIDTIGGEAEIEWEYATTVQRNSALVQAIATQLNLSEADIDQMFQSASQL